MEVSPQPDFGCNLLWPRRSERGFPGELLGMPRSPPPRRGVLCPPPELIGSLYSATPLQFFHPQVVSGRSDTAVARRSWDSEAFCRISAALPLRLHNSTPPFEHGSAVDNLGIPDPLEKAFESLFEKTRWSAIATRSHDASPGSSNTQPPAVCSHRASASTQDTL